MTKYSIIDQALLDGLTREALDKPRRRLNHNFHQLSDPCQRMLNAIEPDSYVRPHRHLSPPKNEAFLVLQGDLSVIIFKEDGTIERSIRLNQASDSRGVDIKPGVWHSLVCHASGTVIFEAKDGPYIPATDKDFASWAPEESSSQVKAYLEKLRQAVS